MKSSIVAGALALTTALAAPVTDSSADISNQAAPNPFLASKFDSPIGDGWVFSPPGSSKSAVLKFYQNNNLMSGRKGSAWVIEFQEDVDAKQVRQLSNIRNAFQQPSPVYQYTPTQPYALPPQQRQAQSLNGAGVGGGSAGTFRAGAASVAPASPATPARPAAPAVLAAPAAPAAIVPAAQLANAVVPAAPAAQALPAAAACQQAPTALQVPAALLAPAALFAPAQGGASITGLIQQAGQLIGQQIGVSIGNVIGSTLEGVVTTYFPAPKAAGG